MKITIPVTPTGQMRDRIGTRAGHGCSFKDKKQRTREFTLAAFLEPHKPPQRLSGPLLLGVKVFLPIPKSKPKSWQAAARAGLTRPIVTPDLDNTVKQIKDVLTAMEFWEDDKLIVEYLPGTGKYYSDSPRWEIEILPWTPGILQGLPCPNCSGTGHDRAENEPCHICGGTRVTG